MEQKARQNTFTRKESLIVSTRGHQTQYSHKWEGKDKDKLTHISGRDANFLVLIFWKGTSGWLAWAPSAEWTSFVRPLFFCFCFFRRSKGSHLNRQVSLAGRKRRDGNSPEFAWILGCRQWLLGTRKPFQWHWSFTSGQVYRCFFIFFQRTSKRITLAKSSQNFCLH